MKNFEDMVLPPGTTVEEVIKASFQEVARVGQANARFRMVDVCGQRMVEMNPGVKEAWRLRDSAGLNPE